MKLNIKFQKVNKQTTLNRKKKKQIKKLSHIIKSTICSFDQPTESRVSQQMLLIMQWREQTKQETQIKRLKYVVLSSKVGNFKHRSRLRMILQWYVSVYRMSVLSLEKPEKKEKEKEISQCRACTIPYKVAHGHTGQYR